MIFVLGLAVTIAACSLARALGYTRRSELVLASWCLGSALMIVPVQSLAALHVLSRGALIAVTVALCALCIGAAALIHRRLPATRARWSLWRTLARPLPAISFGLVALVLAHALVSTWLLPSEAWDGIWYHETIVGFTIQSGSLGPMPLPANLLQQVNGFPRGAEMASVWLVLLSDRRWIELPNTIALIPFAVATFGLVRPFVRSRAIALMLTSVAALTPGAILQLRSTYVDVFVAAACLSSLYFAARRPLERRDVALAGVALFLHVDSKSSALTVAPFVLGLLVARGLRLPKPYAVLSFALLCALSAVGFVYVRNQLLFHNPVYPIAVHWPRIGLDLPGVRAASEVDVNASTSDVLTAIFVPASPGRDFADIRRGGYGLAVAWVILPLSVVGAVRALMLGARRPTSTLARDTQRARARALLLMGAVVAPSVLVSPAIWSARYNLHIVAVASAFAGYALQPLLCRAAAARYVPVLAALGLSALALIRFSPPLQGASFSRLLQAASLDPDARAAATEAEWTLEPAVAAARERELHAGDVVIFGDHVTFPSLLYNERFDNVLIYTGAQGPELARVIAETKPRWIVAVEHDPLYDFVTAHPYEWERVGLASRGHPSIAFRLIARGPAASSVAR